MLEIPGEGVNLRKSAVFCENLRFGLSLSPYKFRPLKLALTSTASRKRQRHSEWARPHTVKMEAGAKGEALGNSQCQVACTQRDPSKEGESRLPHVQKGGVPFERSTAGARWEQKKKQ